MKVTNKQIEEWKATYTDVYMLEADGKVGYIFSPTAKLSVMKMIVSSFMKGNQSATTEAILNNCWLGGDEELKTNDDYRNNLDDQVNDLLELPEYEIETGENHASILTSGISCRVRYATRADIKAAEHKNKQNKPFDTAMHLLDRLAMDDLAEIKQNNKVYLGLLLAINEVKKEKEVAVKKL